MIDLTKRLIIFRLSDKLLAFYLFGSGSFPFLRSETPNVRERDKLFPFTLNFRLPFLAKCFDLFDVSYYVEPPLIVIPKILVFAQLLDNVVSTVAYSIGAVE